MRVSDGTGFLVKTIHVLHPRWWLQQVEHEMVLQVRHVVKWARHTASVQISHTSLGSAWGSVGVNSVVHPGWPHVSWNDRKSDIVAGRRSGQAERADEAGVRVDVQKVYRIAIWMYRITV